MIFGGKPQVSKIIMTTEMISRFEPLSQTTTAVYKKITTYYSDGTTSTEEVLEKILTFDCITDWS